jgi:hypothetical protein
MPDDAVALLRTYLDGKVGTMEFSTKMEALATKNRQAQTVQILTP